jgi:predicted RNA binding protein YcfA (HicA-like mRNA interferase family)
MKPVTGKEMCRGLERRGWNLARIKGSHHIYSRPRAPRQVAAPVHGQRILKAAVQRAIMGEAGLTDDDL